MTAALARQVILYAATGVAVVTIVRQCRKPAGWPGRLMLSIMNRSHAGVTAWGLSRVRVEPWFTILDVGCGGGRTIQRLAAAATSGKVSGVDYSAASVAAARRTNAAAIAAGRVEIQQGSVSRLAFADATFDLVTAVETHYYWPDLVTDLREILRVLKPGGRLVIIAEAYRNSRFNAIHWPAMTLLGARYLSASEHRDVFASAGFTGIELAEERAKGWICVVGRKAQDAAP